MHSEFFFEQSKEVRLVATTAKKARNNKERVNKMELRGLFELSSTIDKIVKMVKQVQKGQIVQPGIKNLLVDGVL